MALDKIFSNSVLIDILSLISLQPDQEFYQAEIMKLTSHRLNEVQRALKKLEQAELVLKEKRGKQIFYKANKNNIIFDDIKRIFVKTTAFGTSFRQALEPFESHISIAFIYGSTAQGVEVLSSDIDLMVVSSIGLKEISLALGPLTRNLQRELNVVVYSEDDFTKKIIEKNHFLLQVMKEQKIWLIGNQNDLEQIIKR